MPKIIYVGVLCFCEKRMNNEVVVCWILNEFVINCYWWCFETCCWWIGVMIMPIGNWWWKLLLLLNICESVVNYWILTKWCFNLGFWASLSMSSCIWPVNIIQDMLSVERSKLECLGKKVLKFEVFFFWTHERSLKRAPSEPKASVPRSLLDTVRLSEL